MSSPYAPVDPSAARWVRALADGLHWVLTEPAAPEARPEWLRLAVAIHVLGLPADLLRRAREADAFDEVAARLRVLHGAEHLLQLHWWAAIRVARQSIGQAADRRVALAFSLSNIARELDWSPRIHDALRDFGADPEDAEEALEQAVRLAEAALGLREQIRFGPVPGTSIHYPAAYRLAMELGDLRASRLLELDGTPDRMRRELEPALELLGFDRTALAVLPGSDDPDGGLWDALDAWFEVGIGGLSDALYRAAHDLAVLAAVPFRGLTFRRALGGLQQAARRLRADAIAAELDALAEEIHTDPIPVGEPPAGLTERIERWLRGVVPRDGLTALEHARIVAWAHKFRGHEPPIDAQRIERFLDQFPGEFRWVGEGLLDALVYRRQAQLGTSLAFVLNSYGLARLPGARLIQSGFREALRHAGLRIPAVSLAEALADRTATTLLFCEDGTITGARAQEQLKILLEPLSAEQRAQLAQRDLVLAFAIGTFVGVDHVGSWLEEQGFSPRILVGHEQRLLSDLGVEELEAGTLYDPDTGWLTQPGTQLADPLFSVHEPAWDGRDSRVARDLCTEIGTALDPRSPLGLGALQSRIVLGQRIPTSTPACLRLAGEWRDRPWEPLFAPEVP